MKVVNLIQGTPEWAAHRAQHLNASDTPAMLGCSSYKTRAELIRETATGFTPEVDAATQKRFDDGHRYEALARPLAEKIVGDELYPCVGVDGKFSASFDGITLLEETIFEHKSLNDTLRGVMADGCRGQDLPLQYRAQMEHQLMVSGAARALFMASKWSGEALVEELHTWYMPDAELRAQIVSGWEQFEKDVAAYEHVEKREHPTAGRAPDQLPSLHIEVTGMVTASNLAEWKGAAIAVFQNISTELQTDQDFADAERTVKWCGEIEDQLKAAKAHALGQTASIDELFRTIDSISAEARSKRLELDKLVKARKDERRSEIGNNARRAVQAHVMAINETMGEHGIAVPATLVADLQAAIKGKKNFASMQDAVDAVVANAKIATSQQAERVRANVAILAEHQQHAALFADRAVLCACKSGEDLRNLVKARISEHEAREAERLEAERARIRQEEAARIERQNREAQERQKREEHARLQQEQADARAEEERQRQEIADAAEAVEKAGAPAAAPATTAAPAPVAADRPGARLKLGDINAAIAPLSISGEGLASLGFQPVAVEKGAKLYDAAQFSAMFDVMYGVLQTAERRALVQISKAA